MFEPSKKHPAFFITVKTNNNTDVFTRDDLCKIIIKSWHYCEKKFNFNLISYVIMPDHIHFILFFKDKKYRIKRKEKIGLRGKFIALQNEELDEFLKIFKSYTGHEVLKILKEEESILLKRLVLRKEKIRNHYFSLWQEEKFNVILNNKEKLQEKIDYIRDNPIKAGLVKNINKYKYIK